MSDLNISPEGKEQVAKSLTYVRNYIEQRNMGKVFEFSYFDRPDTNVLGFGVQNKSGLSLIYVNLNNLPTKDTWIMQIYSGIALNIPDIQVALQWINAKNRKYKHGKFCYAVDDDVPEGTDPKYTSGVVYETSIFGEVFKTFWDIYDHTELPTEPVTSLINFPLRFSIGISAIENEKFVSANGGELFPLSEKGLAVLFVLSMEDTE